MDYFLQNIDIKFEDAHFEIPDIKSSSKHTEIENITHEFQCRVCFSIPPSRRFKLCNKCENILCIDCIDEIRKSVCLCPCCRSNNSFIDPGRLHLKIYDQLKTDCKYKSFGCNLRISYSNLISHENNCEYSFTQCITCKYQIKSEELISHNCVEFLKSKLKDAEAEIQNLKLENLKLNSIKSKNNYKLLPIDEIFHPYRQGGLSSNSNFPDPSYQMRNFSFEEFQFNSQCHVEINGINTNNENANTNHNQNNNDLINMSRTNVEHGLVELLSILEEARDDD
jgi:hypothetical protein